MKTQDSKGLVSKTPESNPAKTPTPSSSQLLKWHKRFGHLGVDGLIKLKNRRMVTGLEELQSGETFVDCVVCHQGKQSRLPFPKEKENPRSLEVLDLIHSDLVGPITPMSSGRSRYILTFLDDRSHYAWVFLLQHKGDVFSVFLEWKAMAELMTGKKVKTFRSDNGGEFVNNHFQDLFAKNGIQHQTSVPHTPQQNGVAERWNRTLLEMARTMLMDGGENLPPSIWGEAVMAAAHVRNRCPSRAIPEDKTPYEVLHGRRPA
jgi:transposase InsO family protein